MKQKIWRKFLVLFMALAVMMPNVVQALDTTVMSESEEITDQKIEETSPEEEPQKFKDEPSEEIIEAEPIVVEEKMSTNLEEEKHLIVGEEPVEEENIDSNTDITPNNVVVNSMEFSFSGTDGSSTATLVGYNGTGGGVVIPSTVVNTAADWGTPSPVTTIGIGAFRSRYLTSISIPSSVTSIELSAFQNNQLRSVVIPSSVTYIGDYAFTINKLTSVTLSANVTSVGISVFANNQLTSVMLPTNVTSVGNSAFANNQLTSVTLPDNVTSVGNSAFANNQLTSVTLPANVTSVGNSAFANNQLTSVTLPDNVTSVGNSTFANNQLTSVRLSANVTSLESSVFANNQLTSVTLPTNVTSVGNSAFANNQLTSVTLPTNVTSVGNSAFVNNRLTSVTIPIGVTSLESSVFADNRLISVKIPNNVKSIEPAVFSGNPLKYIETNAENIDLLRNQLSISAIDGVSERTILRALDYEIGTAKVSNVAFGEDVSYAISQQYQIQSTTNRVWEEYTPTIQWAKNSVNLSGQTGPILKLDSVMTMDSGVYHAVVDTVRYPNLTLAVADEIVESEFIFEFIGTNGNSTATLIGYNGNGGEVVIPSETLNTEAGWGTSSPVTAIGSQVFNTKGLTSVEIPDSVTSIGIYAFSHNQLTSVDIPNSVTEIGVAAFQNNALSAVTIPNNVTRIGQDAFANNDITNLNIFSSISYIGQTAFRDNPLKYIESNIENIDILRNRLSTSVMGGVSERTILRALDYEIGTAKVSNVAFGEDVSYAISQQYQIQSTTNRVWEEYTPTIQWAKNSVNLSGQTGPILKLDSVTTSDSGVYHAVVDTIRYSDINLEVEAESEFVFEYNGTDGDSTATLVGYNGDGGAVVIPSEAVNSEKGWEGSSAVTAIGEEVFRNKRLTSVVIPNSVTSIGVSAFRDNNLTSVDIPNNVTSIGAYAFYQNNLESVTIPNNVTSIERGVFAYNNLTSVVIPNSVTRIEGETFLNNKLTSVAIPNSVTNIGVFAFTENPLKFIETSVENVETLCSILSIETMLGVSERTILRALDYEIGTENEQVASVDQTIDFAISQQYQLQSTANPVWGIYVPEVQWEKDGNAIEGALHKVLHVTNIQELDSGIYRAVVDGIIFSDIQLQVILSIDPEIPSVDPNEPNVSPEDTNPNVEGLSIRYVSDIQFKSAPFSLLDQTLPLDNQENQPMVTVQDMRPRTERSGWELLVSQDSTFMNGAEIIMRPFIHQENQTNLFIEGVSELILNDEPQRFAGTTMIEEPNPFGILSMGMGSGENPMTLRVPGKTGVNSYETTVHWQLVTGP